MTCENQFFFLKKTIKTLKKKQSQLKNKLKENLLTQNLKMQFRAESNTKECVQNIHTGCEQLFKYD